MFNEIESKLRPSRIAERLIRWSNATPGAHALVTDKEKVQDGHTVGVCHATEEIVVIYD